MGDRVTDRVTLLDGGTGTELSRRGLDTSGPLWSAAPLLDAPDVVTEVHGEYAAAGCDVLVTATFRTHARNLEAGGLARPRERQRELAGTAVACAREGASAARGEPVRVAGSIAPLEDCFRPQDVPDAGTLAREHAWQAEALARAGCDLLLVETMNAHREALAATRAAVATGLPTWCSLITDGEGRLLSGEPLEATARAVADAGAEAVLVNCIPVAEAAAEVARLARCLEGSAARVGTYPNVGHDRADGFRPELMVEPEPFAERLLESLGAGATILGGCCGTEPRHISAVRRALPGV